MPSVSFIHKQSGSNANSFLQSLLSFSTLIPSVTLYGLRFLVKINMFGVEVLGFFSEAQQPDFTFLRHRGVYSFSTESYNGELFWWEKPSYPIGIWRPNISFLSVWKEYQNK